MDISMKDRVVLEKHAKSCPVMLGQLARDLGITVRLTTKLGMGVSGQIKKWNGSHLILVNIKEARHRQRFTLAYEIAQFLLCRDVIDGAPDGIRNNILYRSDLVSESLAGEVRNLAMELVMPRELFKGETGSDRDIARKYQVGETLVASYRKRLKEEQVSSRELENG